MKRITMKTLFYIPINKINKKGTVPIYCRLTVNGRRSEISTYIAKAADYQQIFVR